MDGLSESDISQQKQAHEDRVRILMNEYQTSQAAARKIVALELHTTRLQKELEEAKKLATIDALTGLANERALFGDSNAHPPIVGAFHRKISEYQRQQYELEREQNLNELEGSLSPPGFCLVIFDIDDFRSYNANHDLTRGDAVLRAIATLLTSEPGIIRPNDLAFRLHGDEFALLLSDCTKMDGLHAAARIQQTIANNQMENGSSVTVSMGLAHWSDLENIYAENDNPNLNLASRVTSFVSGHLVDHAKSKGGKNCLAYKDDLGNLTIFSQTANK